MNRGIVIEQHKIEALGAWWLEWQAEIKDILIKQVKERTRRQAMSPRAFVVEHLGSSGSDSDSQKLEDSD
jgi:hypothetical protein